MRNLKWRIAVCASLIASAGGCELIAGLKDHELVATSEPTDGSAPTDAPTEAATLGFSISAAPSLIVENGASGSLVVTITRTGGFSDVVNVTASGLPGGATSSPVAIASDATSGSLTINVAQSSGQSVTHLSIDGVSGDGKTNASAKLDLIVRGPSGSLDQFFGNQGISSGFTTSTEVGASAIALDAMNDILVLGDQGYNFGTKFLMLRLTPNGLADTTFAGTGVLTNIFDQEPNIFSGLFPLASGEIQVAGNTGPNAGPYFADFARVTTAGAFDGTYSIDGGPGSSFSMNAGQMTTFAIDSSGRIYAAGGTNPKMHLERRLASGAPDPSFTAGDYAMGTGPAYATSIAVQSDGKVVVLANTSDVGGTGMGLMRFTTSGALDGTFGVAGYIEPSVNTQTTSTIGLAIQSDGKILALGSLNGGSILARFTADGNPDTFGEGGEGVENMGASPTGIVLQSDGKILIAHSTNVTNDAGTASVIEVDRLTTGGIPDPAFGNAGVVQTPIAGSEGAYAGPILVQPDGRIVVAGSAFVSGDTTDFEILRYWP